MNPLTYQLYLLQIENYEIIRYFRLLFRRGFYKANVPLRKRLVWTKKIMLLALLSFAIFAVSTYLFLTLGTLAGVIWIIISFFIAPIYFTLSLLILSPFDYVAKKIVMNRARNLVKNSKLKIIGIAGSYGKTTLKNVIESVLKQKYKVLAPGESINTAVGMSSWIIKNYKKTSEMLIVEFGEEYQGDNKRIAGIFPPDIQVISGINEAHFERIGSIERIAATIFEAVENAKPNARVFLNADDENVKKYYEKYCSTREVKFFSTNDVKAKKFDVDKLHWKAEIAELGEIEIPILGEYILGDVQAANLVAKSLGMENAEIKRGISEIKPVNHRLEPIMGAGGVLVIDDSYNGNPQGVTEAIKVLATFTDRRKLFITPGLVESGSQNKNVHTEIGKKLSAVADKVILIKNSATPYIAEGLKNAGFDDKNIIWHETAKSAHDSLSKILQPGDVILFQNDWGDQHI
ncbi:MAG: UDP-N-acetylmuramoyl-tripeptide--D-alanyl-D-alanine ligase [Patescibacteria group bacterium]